MFWSVFVLLSFGPTNATPDTMVLQAQSATTKGMWDYPGSFKSSYTLDDIGASCHVTSPMGLVHTRGVGGGCSKTNSIFESIYQGWAPSCTTIDASNILTYLAVDQFVPSGCVNVSFDAGSSLSGSNMFVVDGLEEKSMVRDGGDASCEQYCYAGLGSGSWRAVALEQANGVYCSDDCQPVSSVCATIVDRIPDWSLTPSDQIIVRIIPGYGRFVARCAHDVVTDVWSPVASAGADFEFALVADVYYPLCADISCHATCGAVTCSAGTGIWDYWQVKSGDVCSYTLAYLESSSTCAMNHYSALVTVHFGDVAVTTAVGPWEDIAAGQDSLAARVAALDTYVRTAGATGGGITETFYDISTSGNLQSDFQIAVGDETAQTPYTLRGSMVTNAVYRPFQLLELVWNDLGSVAGDSWGSGASAFTFSIPLSWAGVASLTDVPISFSGAVEYLSAWPMRNVFRLIFTFFLGWGFVWSGLKAWMWMWSAYTWSE